MSELSPLSGAKRKLDFGAVRAAFDPQRKSAQRLQLCAMQTLKSPMCGPLVALLTSKRDPRKPANESGHSSYGAADINCDAVGIG
jgi:hypothetical protein